jgi:hypothetical protein
VFAVRNPDDFELALGWASRLDTPEIAVRTHFCGCEVTIHFTSLRWSTCDPEVIAVGRALPIGMPKQCCGGHPSLPGRRKLFVFVLPATTVAEKRFEPPFAIDHTSLPMPEGSSVRIRGAGQDQPEEGEGVRARDGGRRHLGSTAERQTRATARVSTLDRPSVRGLPVKYQAAETAWGTKRSG